MLRRTEAGLCSGQRLALRQGCPPSADTMAVSGFLVDHLEQIWRNPDQELWESHDEPQHFVYSKVMAWVAVDRFLRLDNDCGACEKERRAELETLRYTIHADV